MQSQQPDFNLSSLLEKCSLSEIKEVAYQFSLSMLIEEELYRSNPKAMKLGWKLGDVHLEWDELLMMFQNLNLTAPRDHLKTFFFSEALALKFAKQNPRSRVQIYRATDGLGVETLDKIKIWAEAPYFKSLLDGADLNNKTQLRFSNGSEIYAGGFWSASRGGHPDLIILDDIIDTDVVYSDDANRKSKERLASEIIPMAEPHTRIIIIGTIQRADDLYSLDLGEKWCRRAYDAIKDEEKKLTLFPEKWSWEALMRRKEEITATSGSQWFEKEYSNRAIDVGGAIIKPEWKRTYVELPKHLFLITGWDLSTGKKVDEGDWTAKVTIGVDLNNMNAYLIDYWKARADFGQRVRKLIEFGESEKPKEIKVEDNTFQNDTVQTAKKNSNLPIKGVTTHINKVRKFREVLAPFVENGKFYIQEGNSAHEELWKQMLALPNGQFDDGADALTIAITDLGNPKRAKDYAIVV